MDRGIAGALPHVQHATGSEIVAMKLPMPKDPVHALCVKLGAWAVGMFAFALLIMPPLYEVFCEVTGLNGKTGGRYEAVDIRIDTERTVNVQFVAVTSSGMTWDFAPSVRSIRVHPGEQVRIDYRAFNPTERFMIGQAVPSVTPFKAANYFHKTECFCFEQQPLDANSNAELPLFFIVDQDIPADVHTITLSYTLFDVTERYADRYAGVTR